jgi:two-component system cell cycle sensor histidine kinase/response regulator CckA
MLGLLAMVGVFYLFASAIGFVEFAQGGRAEDIGRSFVDAMADGICILDEKGSIVYSNKAYGEMTGIGRRRGPADAGSRAVASRRCGECRLPPRQQRHSRHGGGRGVPPAERIARRRRGAALVPRLDAASENAGQWRGRCGSGGWPTSPKSVTTRSRHSSNCRRRSTISTRRRSVSSRPTANGRIQYINATLAGWLGIDLTTFGPGSVAVSDIVAGDGMAMINAVRAEAGMTRTAMIDVELAKADGVGLPMQLIHRVHADRDGLPFRPARSC